MDKKPLYKRWWVWFLILALIGGIVSLFDGEDAEKPKDDIATGTEIEETQEEVIKNILLKHVKDEEIEDIMLTGDNSTRIIMKRKIASGSLGKKDLLLKSKEILEDLSKTELEFINLEWKAEFKDKYGELSYNPVMRIDMTKDTLDKINWENFDYKNIEDIADDYWQHNTLE